MTRGERYGRVVSIREGRIFDKSKGQPFPVAGKVQAPVSDEADGRVVVARDGRPIDREDALNAKIDQVSEAAEEVASEKESKPKRRGRPPKDKPEIDTSSSGE